MAGAVKHNYHLVNPSIWPLACSASAMLMMLGAIAWFHTPTIGSNQAPLFGVSGPWLFMISLIGLVTCMIGWWRDVVHESLTGENTALVVRVGLRYGMVFFIASEVMFFAAWFWAFFDASLFPTAGEAIMLVNGEQMLNADGLPAYLMSDSRYHALGGVWPPKDVEPLSAWQLPLLNTLILLLSGTTVTWAHHAIEHNDHKGFMRGLGITILLGIIFSYFQFVEYDEVLRFGAGEDATRMFTFANSVYGGTFFMATGFHGLHVIIGTLFLIVCWFRGRARQFTKDRHLGFVSAAWYWHFVDVVWLFLFAAIYVLGNNGLLS